jgi:hypothetical protein
MNRIFVFIVRPYCGLVAVGFALLVQVAATQRVQAEGIANAYAGADSQTVPFPGIATASHSSQYGIVVEEASSRASPSGLHAMAHQFGIPNPVTAGGSYTSSEDTTFFYESDYHGGQSDWVSFSLSAALTATIFATNQNGGSGSVMARVTVSGALYSAPDDGFPIPSGSATGVVQKSGFVNQNVGMSIPVNEFVSTPTVYVKRGVPISVSMSLEAGAAGSNHLFLYGGATTDASDSLHFNPSEVFTINTPGITVNSPSLGIVNNQMMVPEPSSLLLVTVAGACVVLSMKRRIVADSSCLTCNCNPA